MSVFVADDWAETHHDVHLMTETGVGHNPVVIKDRFHPVDSAR